jgi:hypothetical protein
LIRWLLPKQIFHELCQQGWKPCLPGPRNLYPFHPLNPLTDPLNPLTHPFDPLVVPETNLPRTLPAGLEALPTRLPPIHPFHPFNPLTA